MNDAMDTSGDTMDPTPAQTPFPRTVSPSKILITPELRARMEDNRSKAQARKAELQHAQLIFRQAEAEKKRAAGEVRLQEFGLRPGPSRTRIVVTNPPPDPAQQIAMANEIERAIVVTEQASASQLYVPDPRCSKEQLKVLDEVC